MRIPLSAILISLPVLGFPCQALSRPIERHAQSSHPFTASASRIRPAGSAGKY
jgi:hypothetical protein